MAVNKTNIKRLIKELERVVKGECGAHYDQTGFARKLTYLDETLNAQVSCGTVCCIAGTMVTFNKDFKKFSYDCEWGVATSTGVYKTKSGKTCYIDKTAQKMLGLTDYQADVLFTSLPPIDWPKPFNEQFEQALNERNRAKVAIRLLKRVAVTNGKVLRD